MTKQSENDSNSLSAEVQWVSLVREKVSNLRYGDVQIVVHDGRVIQIERNEKTRLDSGRERIPTK